MKQAKASPAEPTHAQGSANFSSGVATLLRGNNRNPEVRPPQSEVPTSILFSKRGLVRASLWMADGLLFCLAGLLFFRADNGIGLLELFICALAIVLGAWLACLAVLSR